MACPKGWKRARVFFTSICDAPLRSGCNNGGGQLKDEAITFDAVEAVYQAIQYVCCRLRHRCFDDFLSI